MQTLNKILVIVIFLIVSTISIMAAPTSFLPMEDQLSSVRRPVYGASIENIKPYRQIIPVESKKTFSYDFGSKDVLLGVLLLGVYVVLVRKRGKARCAGI